METPAGERVYFNLVSADLTGSAPIVLYDQDGNVRTLKLTERVVITDIQCSAPTGNTYDIYAGVNTTGPLAGQRMFNIITSPFGLPNKWPDLRTPIYSQVGVVPRVRSAFAGNTVITGHAVILPERQLGQTAAAVVDPTTILSGGVLAAWWDTSKPSTLWADVIGSIPATTVVGSWDDLSGNGNRLTNGGGTDRPTLSGGGVAFDGTNDVLFSTFTLNQPAEIMAVWKIPSGKITNERFISAGALNNVGTYFQIGTPTKIALFDTGLLTTTDNLVFDAPSQIRGLFNNASSEIQINRGTTTSGTIGGSDPLGGISLGVNRGTGLYGSFTLYELVVANAAMSGAQRTALSNYLLAKWGA
jgi:hypothetical protein